MRPSPCGGGATTTGGAPAFLPRSSSTTWSAIARTFGSCVATMKVVPRAVAALIAPRSVSALSRSSSAVGSSTITTGASRASATANAARASSPPESWDARPCRRWATPSSSKSSRGALRGMLGDRQMRKEIVGGALRHVGDAFTSEAQQLPAAESRGVGPVDDDPTRRSAARVLRAGAVASTCRCLRHRRVRSSRRRE